MATGWLAATALTAEAAGMPPYSFESAPGRLPKDVVPLDYTVSIVPNARARTLEGRESVTLEFRATTARIVFNSLNQRLAQVTLDGRPVRSVASDNGRQLTTVTLATPAAIGRHTLAFSYRGRIESGPVGLFAQPFVEGGRRRDVMLSTQFEATDARRMFPCWDEPAFRATFELQVTVPTGWATVSNMPVASRVTHGALATTTFQRTPRMASYLLEFSAGDLAAITAESGGVRFGVWAVRGRERDGAVALADAQQILADYNDYFGTAFPLPKLDSIAVPGGFQGAMENWGAITYNEALLLVTPSSTVAERQRVFDIQAHEIAHQWNGDLVTMGWWDEVWLNESFASWRGAKETELRHPEWHWIEGRDGRKEGAMRADARRTSHPIQQPVTDELQAESSFDGDITYSKGEAVLRMFEAYLGPETFRDGIRRFMKAHAYSNATSADLWHALGEASGQPVGEVIAPWIEQPGFPIVFVTADCDAAGGRTIRFSQRQFLLRGVDPDHSRWSVPLRIRIGAGGTPQSVLLRQDGQSVVAGRCDEALSVNAGATGFYRVAYDEPTLATDTRQFARLASGDRIALLDDQWALVQAGLQPLPTYLALASAMGSDLNERAWGQVAVALATIESNERDTPGYEAFTAYARALLKPVADRLGWAATAGETPGLEQLRRTVIGDLGAWGDAGIVAEARWRFAALVADRGAIRPDEQETILGIVARNADAATFAQLHALARSARNEAEVSRYFAALMHVRDPQLAERAVEIALSAEVPPQAAALRLGFVFAIGDEHPQLSWRTFTAHDASLMAPHEPFVPVVIAERIPVAMWKAVPPDQLEAWVTAHVPAEMAPNVARGMEEARFRIELRRALVEAADAYVRARPRDAAGAPLAGAR